MKGNQDSDQPINMSARSKKHDGLKDPVISGRKYMKQDTSSDRQRSYQIDIQETEEERLEKIDINRAPVEVVEKAALSIQDKSKAAVERMLGKLGMAEELAKEELVEL